jgi:hypothetical protein
MGVTIVAVDGGDNGDLEIIGQVGFPQSNAITTEIGLAQGS